MVCLSDSDTVLFVKVQDALDQSNERTSSVTLTPDKTVESVISEVMKNLTYERNNVQLVFKAYGTNTEAIPLDPTKHNTMRDTGVDFNLISKAVIVVTPSQCPDYKNVYSGFFDEGAPAEPLPPPAPAPPTPPPPSLIYKSCKRWEGGTSSEAPATSPPPSLITNAVAVPTSGHERVSSISDYYAYKRWEGGTSSEAPEAPFNYVGLVNQAMTCYLNSLLQALYMTPEFRNALYNWEFDGNNPSKSIPFQLQKLFLNLQTSTKSAVETTDLTHSFGWNMQHAWEQHDIQELCRVMFDALEQKFKDTQQSNLINDLYEGKMLDYVKCLECGTEKSREDTFLDIPLPVRPFGSSVAYNSIEEALRAFVQPETLNDNNQYNCERCGKKCDAHKGLKFIKFPYLLTLHLKRFDFDYSTMNRIKLNDKVVFPEKLNLNSFVPAASPMSEDAVDEREMMVKCDDCSTTDSGSALDDDGCQGTDVSSTANGPDDTCQDDDEGIDVSSGNNQHENEKNRLQEPKGPYIYELFSIMIHSGSASGGHYYAYIKDFSKNQWFCFNDQMVTRVTEDDIHKTYGGGPHRGYYSGAYTSSTNAYMLMYRQIDPERNREALTVDDFPLHIKRLLEDVRKKEASDRLRKEQESDMYDVRVTCLHPIQNQLIDKKMYVYSELTIGELKSEVHGRFKLKDIVREEDCRLVAYNRGMETIKCSLDGEDVKFQDVDSKYNEFFLEIKEPSATFEEYKLGGVIMKVYHIDMETEEVDGPRKIWVNAGDTVRQLKRRLAAMFGLSAVHVVQEAYNNDPRYVADDGPLNFDPRLKGHKLYVADSLDPDPLADHSFPTSKLASVIDRFVHLIMLEISLPETDAATLDQLSIPSLDVNQNLDKIDVGDRGASNSSSLRVSPQPGSGNCELFGDQSNSEDSSLSDSDRTLVGDAPGDNLGLLSSNSNSPTDQHMASPTEQNDEAYPDMAFMHHRKEEMFWEDEDLSSSCPEKACTANYYFKAHFHDPKSVQILVDKRTSLSKLKMNLEPIVGVPKEYFKIYRQYPNQDVSEWATLTETLNSLKDGDRLTVKLGRVLKENEYAGKIYYLQPNHVEPVTFWFEWIVAKEQTVASVKKEILQMAKTQYMVDIPFNRCRLRKKYLKEASRILLDDERFNDSVIITSNFELYVQKIEGAEKRNSRQLALFARRWHPDRLALSPFEEIVIDNKTLEDLKRTISETSGIPLEFVEVTFIKGSFLCDMNVLDVHTKLDWNPDSKCFLLLYDDGSTVYYRDSRDTLKELTTEERKELNHSENKRLGRISRKTYSPRRECGLKIYVDTSPKKEDDVFLD